jgi:hypothetical protein
VQDASGPEALIYQLLWCWEANSRLKPTVPTESEWYARTATHANWLTADHNRLSTALETHTGIQPTENPEPLWVERRLSSLIKSLLPILAAQGEWNRTIGVLDTINQAVFRLAMRMQFDEAFMLLDVVTSYRSRIPQPDSESMDDTASLFRLGVAEREVLGFTSLWLGLSRPLEQLDPKRLAESFDKAVGNDRASYKASAPRDLLRLFEDAAKGIELEQRTEHHRITPDWWLHHMSARHFATTVCNAVTALVSAVEQTLVAPLLSTDSTDAQLIAVRVFDLMELLHKILYHMQIVRSAYVKLEALRHDPSHDELWPALPSPDDALQNLEEQLLRRLAATAPSLATSSHDPSQPDLFGQAYRRLFNAAFRAVIESRTELATVLFPMIIEVAERARLRLGTDLSDQREREQVIFGTEPFLDMMELSGYALLMSRIDPPGIRSIVETTWNAILDSTTMPDLTGLLLGVLDLQESNIALTSGGIARAQRQMELARLLRTRGIFRDYDGWGHEEHVAHDDPVVAVFAPDDMMGLYHNLADLFVVDYLMGRPEMEGHSVPRQVEQLQEAIDFERERRDDSDESGEVEP